VDVTKIVAGSGDIAAERSSVANFSRVADRIWTGGDLHSHLGDVAMLAALAAIQAAGITHILDNRLECSDERFVRAHAPKIDYFWNGQDDAG
jgi:dual specificity phosphatase 3